MNKLKRTYINSDSDSDSDSISSLDENDEVDGNNNGIQQLNAATEGYYWPGKDYANTYKEDFKDLTQFSTGIPQFLCKFENTQEIKLYLHHRPI